MPETQWDLAWANRPPEEARNLNPAFCVGPLRSHPSYGGGAQTCRVISTCGVQQPSC